MKIKKGLGGWAFLIGVIVAVLAGLFVQDLSSNATIVGVLVVIGIIVGLFNVTAKEAQSFLLASVALVIVSFFGGSIIGTSIKVLGTVLSAILILIVPAAVVVSIREAFNVAKS